ncbi:hypothetical protein ACFPZ0_10020 [Streptomonospora nanhaiensis]|uniref:Uncharacterized protein n=1 Tax=Streptomonospora nanhaiensis TaxID=1323731 RepID=A0A853BS44_9ACTN|nr:hypothetical protein [Streptomonospora nanhaiensis]MBV2362688.1 hypothetical protein [Streptomonospora nanhaiensis]MBX9389146.1 hypothetical protein [Streptomonospora nanhaiensis]NYI97963.1 hypothetical protein [Streptomonospora nanhaiensis]
MSSRPITITLAAAVQALVAAALAVGGGYVLIGTLLGEAADAGSALPLAVLAFAAAAAVGYTAWGLWHLRNWARTPVVLTHVFVLVIAYYMVTSEQYAIAAVLAATAAAGAALVLAPATTATLFPADDDSAPGGRGPR